jgi:hypothetical protein
MGILDWLFGKKKIGLDPDNKDKYIYYNNSGPPEDVRDLSVWNAYTEENETERGDIYSEEYHPNGKLKKITIRKTVSLIWQNGKGLDEEKRQVIRTFYENGNKKSEDIYKFYDRSSTYKKNGMSFEYYEPDNGSNQWIIDENAHWKSIIWENGRKKDESVRKNGKWIHSQKQRVSPAPIFPLPPLTQKKEKHYNFHYQDLNKEKIKSPGSINLNKEQEKVVSYYPNLRGIDFSKVKFGPSGNPDTPMGYYASDIDGDWHFTFSQMAILFKAFSKDNFENNLHELLAKNEINFGDKIEKTTTISEHWVGNGFQIEHAAEDKIDLIFITNENIIPEDSFSLSKTNLAPEVSLPTGYENIGIKHVYDGPKFLKANNGKFSLNIPLLFIQKEPELLNHILIGVSTLTLAKIIIDEIIEKNHGKIYFTKEEDNDDFTYMHSNKYFFIGFMKKHLCVRINMLHKLTNLDPSKKSN